MLKKQLFRFIIVGIVNTFVGYALYAIFIFVGLNYFWSVLFATILGVMFNFKSISKFVFEANDNSLIFRFVSVYVVVFIVNVSLIKVLKILSLNDYYAGIIALFPTAAISFVLNKYFVYKK